MAEDDVDQPAPNVFQEATAKSLQTEIDNYTRGRCSERDAISAISRLIWIDGTAAGIDDDKLREALDSHIEVIQDITRDVNRHLERNTNRIPSRGLSHERTLSQAPDNLQQTGGDAGNEDDRERPGVGLGKRRGRSASIAGDLGEPAPKRVIDESRFPFSSSTLQTVFTHPTLVETNKAKSNYKLDLALATARVLESSGLPALPRGLWRDILQGHFIEYDKLLTSVLCLTGDATEVKRMGDVEIITDNVKTTRFVRDRLEWVECHQLYSEAVIFCFPGRNKELTEYGTYIMRLFTSTHVRYHTAVLNYDRAIRTKVGRSNDLMLTDWGSYADLHHAYLSSIGSAAQEVFHPTSHASTSAQSKAPRFAAGASINELCERFQIARIHDRCSRVHACSICNDPKHGRVNCPRNKGSKPSA